jgi:hypothetical protein
LIVVFTSIRRSPQMKSVRLRRVGPDVSIQLPPRNLSEQKLPEAPALGIIRRAQALREIGDHLDGVHGSFQAT